MATTIIEEGESVKEWKSEPQRGIFMPCLSSEGDIGFLLRLIDEAFRAKTMMEAAHI